MADAPTWSDGTPSGAALPTPQVRYRDEGRIALGGMSEVRRVWDRQFGFYAAMKLLRPELLDTDSAQARFRAEALITARIQHPGVVAVYDQGETAAGQPWFTMTEVRGETFGALIARAYATGPIAPGELRRLVGLLLRATEAVAYAHSQGILHRDIKPENLMVGPFGEVLVMDWGLARALDLPDDATARDVAMPDAAMTAIGQVLGTPAYMPPEQARGQLDALGPTADVFSLGAVLYELITGQPLDRGPGAAVWRRRMRGPPILFDGIDTDHLPDALLIVCVCCLEDDPADRYADAGAFAAVLRDWLDGAQRRARALEIVAQAAAQRPAIDALRAQATDKRARAAAIMAPLQPHSPVDQKAPAWDLEDQAAELESTAAVQEVRWQQVVGTALQQVPDLPEAHAMLADHYAGRLRAAEQEGRRAEVARFETLLADHDRGRYASLLTGIGAVTLVTDPPGAEVRLYQYVEKRRRLVPEFRRVLGRTPLIEVPLEHGSWLFELHREGYPVVNYPVYLERGASWDGVRPGGHEPYPIVLPKRGELSEWECYVPAGWFIAGGDPMAVDSLPRRWVWVDGFCVDRFVVSGGEYLSYLQSLPQREGLLPVADVSGQTPLVSEYAGRLTLSIDQSGRQWQPSWPIVGLDWHAAQAFAHHHHQRLLHELEWSKAARGVDGRTMPWGNTLESTWCAVMDSTAGAPDPSPVDTYPIDCSPYGVRGVAGGVRQ
ncbi:MAG: SUMF1/EgtB/PvdO family nonheme iron enzyme, partial [Myxococcota bacterium]